MPPQRAPAGVLLHRELRAWPGFALGEVARLVRTHTDAMLAATGLRWDDVAVLAVLEPDRGMSLTAVSERTGIDRTTLGPLIIDLEDEALVTCATSQRDRRRMLVSRAPRTVPALGEARDAIEGAERKALRRLHVRERERLAELAARALPHGLKQA